MKKTFAILTDIHGNTPSLKKGLEIIEKRNAVDQIVCLGDCFSLGPDPKGILELLQRLENCVFIRGNHDRYLVESLWTQELPTLEGMDPYDPVCRAIVANEKWTADIIGENGLSFIHKMRIAHREFIGNTAVEFTHAWFQRDDLPPKLEETFLWRDHVQVENTHLDRFVFVHGHTHMPRIDKKENLSVFCQGATGLPFDEIPRGSVAFLTIGDEIEWDVVRYDYDLEATISMLEERKPPFYQNLMKTVKHASIRNDV